MAHTLRSRPVKIFLVKLWCPLLMLGFPALLVAGGTRLGRIISIPCVLIALWLFSAAIVDCRSGVIRYRRLFTWKTLDWEQVVSANLVWPDLQGVIRLRNYLFPWGNLYFVLDDNLARPFHRPEYATIDYINSHARGRSS